MANVLIDTQVFRAHSFNFERPEFVRLRELAESGKVQVVITRMIDGEVKRQITEQAVEGQRAIRNTLKEFPVLQHSPKVPFDLLVAKGAISDLTDIRLKQWEDWKEALSVEEIPSEGVDVDSITDAYFSQRPPFGTGGKKAEFPDAITLAAAQLWAIEKDDTLYVVSEDKDLIAFCESVTEFSHVPTLSAFVERFADKYIVDAVREALGNHEAEIIDAATDQFRLVTVVLEEVEGEVDAINADSITILGMNIIQAEDGEGVAEIDVSIDFTADVEYEDPNSGIWDSEDGVMLFVETASAELHDSTEAVLTIKFYYEEDDPKDVTIMDVTIDDKTRYLSLPDDGY